MAYVPPPPTTAYKRKQVEQLPVPEWRPPLPPSTDVVLVHAPGAACAYCGRPLDNCGCGAKQPRRQP